MPSLGYKDHYELKKMRLVILKKYDWKCDICGSEAAEVHHKDESRDNHEENNLVPLCKRCHFDIHAVHLDKPFWDMGKIELLLMSKGLDKKELSEKIGMTHTAVYAFFKKGTTKNSTVRKIAEVLDADLNDLIIYGKIKEGKENK